MTAFRRPPATARAGRAVLWLASVGVGLLAGLHALGGCARRAAVLADGRVDERIGAAVPRDAEFIDQAGRRLRFGDLFDGQEPVLLVPAYYSCPMLCGLVLGGTASALASLPEDERLRVRAVALSFDGADDPASAAAARERTIDGLGGRTSAGDWPFLVGDAAEVRALLDAAGYRYVRDDSGEYAHAAASILLTPDARVSSYIYGVEPPRERLASAIARARRGATTTVVDRVLMRCFRYVPALRRHGRAVEAFLHTGAILAAFAVAAVFGLAWRHDAGLRRTRSGRS